MNLTDNNFQEILRNEVLKDDQSSNLLVSGKIKKALKIGKLLSRAPGVTSVILCNNLGFGIANEASDLDFLILTKQGQIWIARFFCMLATKMFGYRITNGNKKDKACLSFFIAPSGYDLSKIAIEDDVYLRNWLLALKPISGFAEFERFIEANRLQLVRHSESIVITNPIRHSELSSSRNVSEGSHNQLGMRFLVALGMTNRGMTTSGMTNRYGSNPWFERLLEKIQRKHFNYQKKILLDSGGSEVIASESMLKFHVNDRRRYYRELYRKSSI